MGYIHIAAVGEDPDPVLAAVRELGAEKVILVTGPDLDDDAGAADVLEPLGVDTERRTVSGSMLLGTLQLVQDIVAKHPDRREDIIVNLAGAGRYESCALLSAAFVAGVRAIDRHEDEIRFLPALNFSYDEIVGSEKLQILQGLDALDGEAEGLNALTAETDLDSSTVSYQIRGGKDTKGLDELGLVEIEHDSEAGVTLRLTPMGETLARSMQL